MAFPTSPIDDGGTVTPPTPAYKPVDELVGVVLDPTLPRQVRAAALVATSDALDEARARGVCVFEVLGVLTAEPELFVARVLFGVLPPAA